MPKGRASMSLNVPQKVSDKVSKASARDSSPDNMETSSRQNTNTKKAARN
jgi:hypothetical protein